MVDPSLNRGHAAPVPGPAQQRLTPAQAKKLRAVMRRIEDGQREWALLVKAYGVSAVARELGITPQAVSARVKKLLDTGA
jgi:DNA-binding MarR family transcriptional regulator